MQTDEFNSGTLSMDRTKILAAAPYGDQWLDNGPECKKGQLENNERYKFGATYMLWSFRV